MGRSPDFRLLVKLGPMKTIRTFIAIPLPAGLAQDAAGWVRQARREGDGIKWVPEDNFHLTLKFLGEVENVETPRVCDLLESICADFEPFELNFGGAGGLPELDRARVLTVRIDDPTGKLIELATRIDVAFADLGFKREPRDYRPHLTLGRARANVRKASADVIERWSVNRDRELGAMMADHLQVIGSFLEKRGPTYNVMDTIDL